VTGYGIDRRVMIDAATVACCSAEPYVATENSFDPRTSASAGHRRCV